MARPIEPTPVLTGKDAKDFLAKTENAVLTTKRSQYLDDLARASEAAEQHPTEATHR